MPEASEYLLDIDAVDADGEALTIRIGTCGYITSPSDDPPNTIYINAISDPGDWSIDLFDAGKTMGEGHPSYGNVSVVNTDGMFDDWTMTQGQKLDGRPYTMRRLVGGSAPYSSAEIVASGIIDIINTGNGWVDIDIVLLDRTAILDQPLQTTRYAGTTTSGVAPVLAEGNADLKDQPKPVIVGDVQNVEPAAANIYDQIYQVNDGPVTSIVAFEGRIPLVNAGDFATVTALKTSLTTSDAIKTGQYGTVLAAGLAGFRCTPSKPLTVNAVEGTSNRPGSVMRRILERFDLDAGSDFDAATFAALDAAAPYDLGVEVQGDENCSAVLSRVRTSVGAYFYPTPLGVFRTGRFTGPGAPVGEIVIDDVLTTSPTDTIELEPNPDTNGKPAWRIVVNYAPIGLVQDASQLGDCVDAVTRAFVGVQTRQVTAEDADILELHPDAIELTINTLLRDQASAQALANLHLSLHGVERKMLQHLVRIEDMKWMPGDTLTVTLPRLGFQDGRDMVLIGVKLARRDERAALTFWG